MNINEIISLCEEYERKKNIAIRAGFGDKAANIAADVVGVRALEVLPELVQRIEQLEKENVWLSRAAANSGWHGVRVSPDFMQKQARVAVKNNIEDKEHE